MQMLWLVSPEVVPGTGSQRKYRQAWARRKYLPPQTDPENFLSLNFIFQKQDSTLQCFMGGMLWKVEVVWTFSVSIKYLPPQTLSENFASANLVCSKRISLIFFLFAVFSLKGTPIKQSMMYTLKEEDGDKWYAFFVFLYLFVFCILVPPRWGWGPMYPTFLWEGFQSSRPAPSQAEPDVKEET